MDKRHDKIKSDIETAESLKEDADKMKEEISAELAKSRETAQDIINRAQKTADVQKEEIIASAEAEANKIVEKANAEIKEEKEKAEIIFDKFKHGKKLSTEELLLLQKYDIN